MILKIAIIDMNILKFNIDNSFSSIPNKNSNTLQLDSISTPPQNEITIAQEVIESNDSLSKLISNSINSLI